MARGLRAAAHLEEEGVLDAAVAQRYASFGSGIGQRIDDGSASLEDLEVRF